MSRTSENTCHTRKSVQGCIPSRKAIVANRCYQVRTPVNLDARCPYWLIVFALPAALLTELGIPCCMRRHGGQLATVAFADTRDQERLAIALAL